MKRRMNIRRLFFLMLLGICLITLGKTDIKAESLSADMEKSSIVKDAGVAFPARERSLLEGEQSASDISYWKARSSHLNYGYIQIDKVNERRAGILGTTQCHHVCPEVYLTIMLDQQNKETGDWEQIRFWEYSAENVDHLTKDLELYVPTGYVYSVRGFHSCIHGNEVESTETATDGIYIGKTDVPVD